MTIDAYYLQIETHEYISVDELRVFFFHLNPKIKDKELYDSLFDRMEALEVSESMVTSVIKNLIEKDYANRIVNKLIPVLNESAYGSLKDIRSELEQYEEVVQLKSEESSPFVEDELEELLEENVTGEGLSWRLHCLNNDLGSLRGGSLGHVFARPDTGKTSFLASEVTNFATQLKEDECIIYFNNEEKGGKVRLRTYMACLNATTAMIVSNKDKAKQMYDERGGNKIKLYDSAIITFNEIKKVIKEYKPRLVVIDQGDKVSFKGEGELSQTDRLQKLYQKFRELAKEFDCDIITVGQCSAEGEGKKWLSMDMCNNSKTGKVGELDYLIGIGKTFADGEEDLRFIHIAKNKCKNGTHGKHTCLFDNEKARYKDV